MGTGEKYCVGASPQEGPGYQGTRNLGGHSMFEEVSYLSGSRYSIQQECGGEGG